MTIFNPSHSGGERAARDLELLTEKNIKAVINCTDDLRWKNQFTKKDNNVKTFSFRNYHDDRLSYYNFNVAWWRKYVGDSEVWTWQVTPLSFISLFQEGLAKFLSPCISFIEAELAMGRSVLVHCLAGAHRSLLTQSTAKITWFYFYRAGTTGIICLMHFAGLESHKVWAFRFILFKHLYLSFRQSWRQRPWEASFSQLEIFNNY